MPETLPIDKRLLPFIIKSPLNLDKAAKCVGVTREELLLSIQQSNLLRLEEVDDEWCVTLTQTGEQYVHFESIEPVILEEEIERKEIVLPGTGKLISDFAVEIGEEIKDKNTLFFRIDSREIVEINKIKLHNDGTDVYTGFSAIKPNRFITLAEKYFVPGKEIWNNAIRDREFQKKSMGADLANALLSAEVLQQKLPQINRIFTIPVPIDVTGELTFPKRGYDQRFYSWLPYNAPEISKPDMSVEEAKGIIYSIFREFCFQTKQDYTNAVAGLLTPFLRGMFKRFNQRTPVFFYIANRERAGKDYLAGVSGIMYEGASLEDSPICSSEAASNNSNEEFRKKILSAMIGGRKRMHFSNNKGFINNAAFEAAITAEKYTDRILGRNETLSFDNEIDFSISGNTGIGFTPDFAARCRFIRLFYGEEDANARKFDNPDLHGWVLENRGEILSAMYALVRNWIEKGKPEGKIPFSSFQEWAKVCGGIMESAGYDNPCVPDEVVLGLGGDRETSDMKQLFELCYEHHPEMWIKKTEIDDLIQNTESDIFGYLDLGSKQDQSKFGKKLLKFVGRTLSNIRLEIDDTKSKGSRRKFRFTKTTHSVNLSEIFGDVDSILVKVDKVVKVLLPPRVKSKKVQVVCKTLTPFTTLTSTTEKEAKLENCAENENINLNNLNEKLKLWKLSEYCKTQCSADFLFNNFDIKQEMLEHWTKLGLIIETHPDTFLLVGG